MHWYRSHRAVVALALVLPAFAGAVHAATEYPLEVVELHSSLEVPFETIHTDWAAPYAGGRIRVMYITGKNHTTMLGVTRYAVETQQRFDIEADVVMVESGVFGGGAGEERLKRLLEKPYDCYVVRLGDAIDRIPTELREIIMQHVRDGAGMVLPAGKDTNKQIVAEAKPLDSMPESVSNRPIEAFTFGKGRLATAPIDQGWNLGEPDATPEDRIFGVALKRDLSYEATGRAILWAARREPKLRVTIDLGDATIARGDLADQQIKVSWTGSSSATPLTLSATFRRQEQGFWINSAFGDAGMAQLTTSRTAEGTVQLPMPRLAAGDHWMYVVARSERGVEGWALTPFTVTAEENVSDLNLVSEWGEAGGNIEGSVKVDSPHRGERTLHVNALDRYGRVLARRAFKAPEADVKFVLPTASWMPNYIGVEAVLVAGDEPVCMTYAPKAYTIPKRKQDEWNMVFWGRMHAHQSLDIIEDTLARCGGGSRYETTRQAWWPMSRAGMNYGAYCEAGLQRQNWYGASTPKASWRRDTIAFDEKGEFKIGCWNDQPASDNRVRKWLDNEMAYRRHGCLVYSMGDEKDFWGSCLHPSCMKKYRTYLQQQYGTIEALNESWSTDFASFDEVELSEPDNDRYRNNLRKTYGTIDAYNKEWITRFDSFDEITLETRDVNSERMALSEGNLPRHYDRLAFQAWNFGQHAGRFRRVARERDPHAIGGVEGAGWIFDDIDIIVRNTDWWILYGIPAAEVVRSIAPRGYKIGHWVGYTSFHRANPKYALSDFWLSFLRGGNSIGYFHTRSFLGATLGPGPLGGGEVAETGRVVFDGLGTLLNIRSQMQHDGVVMLHSFASGQASYLEPSREYGIYSGYLSNAENDKWLKMGENESDHWKEGTHPRHGGCNNYNWQRAIRAVGLQFEYVTDRMLRRGEFVADDYKVMILPQCEALGPKEIAAIRKFAEDGGTVIADIRPAIFDGHLKLRSGGGLDDLFGVRHTDNVPPIEAQGVIEGTIGEDTVRATIPDLRVNPAIELAGGEALGRADGVPICIVNRYGQGRAVLLNFPTYSFSNLSLPETPEADATFLSALFATSGVEWPLRLFNEDGNRRRNMEAVRWKTGSGEQVVALYGPLHDTRAQWKEPQGGNLSLKRILAHDVNRPVRVELHEPKHITLIGGEEPMGHTRSFTVPTRPWRPTFVAITDEAPKAPRLKPATRHAERGRHVHFEAEVPGARGLRALKIRVTTPDGREARWFDRSVMAEPLGAQISFPVAINEQSGSWTVTATDLYTGNSASASFMVK